MNEYEYYAGLENTIRDACDGDRPDNFARSLTVQEIIDTYIKILELEKEKYR